MRFKRSIAEGLVCAHSDEESRAVTMVRRAQIVRRWQSVRAIDGSLHFWIGRSKTPPRTDIAPAIRFDLVEWK